MNRILFVTKNESHTAKIIESFVRDEKDKGHSKYVIVLGENEIMAMSWHAALLGRSFDKIICLVSSSDMDSEVEKENFGIFRREYLPTKLNDPKNNKVIDI